MCAAMQDAGSSGSYCYNVELNIKHGPGVKYARVGPLLSGRGSRWCEDKDEFLRSSPELHLSHRLLICLGAAQPAARLLAAQPSSQWWGQNSQVAVNKLKWQIFRDLCLLTTRTQSMVAVWSEYDWWNSSVLSATAPPSWYLSIKYD